METKREYMCKERIVDLEFKISRLGLLGKAYYDLVQIKLKRHRNQISTARTQNMLLHAALDTLRHKAKIARKNLGDLENLRKTVASLRVTYDHQRKLVFSRQQKLEAQVTDTHSSEIECAGVLDPNTPDLVRIRHLEAMLNAIRLKTKDVQILMRHYEASLKPMKEEYASYSAKLESVRNILNMKVVECEKLINSHHDAIRARDAAKKELEELIGKLFGKDGRDMASPDLQNKILAAIKEIKEVMEVGSMREMYHQFILQEKQSAYLESIYVELKRTVDQLKNEYPPRRRSSIQPHVVHSMIEGTKVMVRRQSSRKGSIPLLQILDGIQKLVERLHEGNLTMPSEEGEIKEVLTQCQERISNLVQALHRKMKHMNREAYRKAKEAAKAAGQEYVGEARFAELDAEEDARKATKEAHKAEVRREIAAREAEAQRQEEERPAAKEARRQQIREEMDAIREKSRKEAEEQAEAHRKWHKELEAARAAQIVAAKEKSVTIAESMTHAVVPSGNALGGGSPAEPAQTGQEGPPTAEVFSSMHAPQTDAGKAEHPSVVEPGPTEKTDETSSMIDEGESTKEVAQFPPPSEAKEEVPVVEATSSTESEIQLRAVRSSAQHEEKIGPPETAPPVIVTFTSGPETEDVRIHLLAVLPFEDEEMTGVLAEGETSAVPVMSTSEHAHLSEEGKLPEVQTSASPSSQETSVVPVPSTSDHAQLSEEEKIPHEVQTSASPSALQEISAVPVPSTSEHAQLSEEESKPHEVQTSASPSSSVETSAVPFPSTSDHAQLSEEEKIPHEVQTSASPSALQEISAVPVPSTSEHAQLSEEESKPHEVQTSASPSSSVETSAVPFPSTSEHGQRSEQERKQPEVLTSASPSSSVETSMVPVPSTSEHAQLSEDEKTLPEIQTSASPSSTEHDSTETTAPTE